MRQETAATSATTYNRPLTLLQAADRNAFESLPRYDGHGEDRRIVLLHSKKPNTTPSRIFLVCRSVEER